MCNFSKAVYRSFRWVWIAIERDSIERICTKAALESNRFLALKRLNGAMYPHWTATELLNAFYSFPEMFTRNKKQISGDSGALLDMLRESLHIVARES